MLFSELASYFQKLELTASRNEMTVILADLFQKASAEEIDKICYLIQGRVAPLFVALEFGMADKMIIRVISRAYGIEEKEIAKEMGKMGDLGEVAEKLLRLDTRGWKIDKEAGSLKLDNKQSFSTNQISNLKSQDLTSSFQRLVSNISVSDVFSVLQEIALSSGSGSVEKKIILLSDLLKKLDPLSARYVVRIPVAKMRLGFSDMTVLDALSWMITKDKEDMKIKDRKEYRKEIETAYNVKPDLGFIARKIKEMGIKGIKEIGPEVGTPILMARAERLSSGKEIIEKIGKCAIEPKLDGFRVQVHYSKKGIVRHSGEERSDDSRITQVGFWTSQNDDDIKRRVRLFSRNLEDVTLMYPDIVEAVVKQVKAKEAIFEGEAIGWDEKKQKYLAFQETVQRRRKYDIKEMTKSVPLKLVVFDLLYVDGVNMIEKTFLERRKRLEEIL